MFFAYTSWQIIQEVHVIKHESLWEYWEETSNETASLKRLWSTMNGYVSDKWGVVGFWSTGFMTVWTRMTVWMMVWRSRVNHVFFPLRSLSGRAFTTRNKSHSSVKQYNRQNDKHLRSEIPKIRIDRPWIVVLHSRCVFIVWRSHVIRTSVIVSPRRRWSSLTLRGKTHMRNIYIEKQKVNQVSNERKNSFWL